MENSSRIHLLAPRVSIKLRISALSSSENKHQAPSSKLQRSAKFQAPTFGILGLGFFWSLEFGAWDFSGSWISVLGASEGSLPPPVQPNQHPLHHQFFARDQIGIARVLRF